MTDDNISHSEIVEKIRPELEKVISFLDREFQKLRTERASPSLVEDLEVDCFGQRFTLKQLAAISTPRPKEIVIQPWDKSYVEDIVKALEKRSKMGGNPIVDQHVIRINIPPLSEEFRKDLIRFMAEKQEEAKKTIRRWRDEAWREIQERFKEGKIREDDKFRGKDDLQKLVDEFSDKIEEMVQRKRKEIEG